MSERAEGTKKEGKGKKQHKNKPTSKKWEHYTMQDSKLKADTHCPRCGPGIFLAQHQNRSSCGKCKYTEFLKN